MTVRQDTERADMRALMADTKQTLPDYSEDADTADRVGQAIGDTATNEERTVRASDAGRRSTDKYVQEPRGDASSVWLWWLAILVGAAFLLVGLAFWHLG